MSQPKHPETNMNGEESLVRGQLDLLLTNYPPTTTVEEEFWGAQYDLGLAWVHFPRGLGGLGVSPAFQDLVSNSLRTSGAPSNFLKNPIGIGMGAPAILTHGPIELTSRLLRPMFTCAEIWCQLFSEPGAGSDVASVSTKATIDGDEWVINGQKVWTTLAHVAKWGMLLARTNMDVPKHSGLTYFLVDLTTPGVEIRPLRQITGEAEFNEVYFENARIPDAYRIGNIGEGWKVAVTTLMNERVSLGGTVTERGSGAIRDAMDIWQKVKHRNPIDKDVLVSLWIEAEVNRLTNIRANQMRQAGNPGPEGSVAKLASAELNKKIYNFCINLMGPEALSYSSYKMTRPDVVRVRTEGEETDIQKMFLRSRANSIEGGTSEIMKNILGERVLGLPGEPRVDKELPFSRIPKN